MTKYPHLSSYRGKRLKVAFCDILFFAAKINKTGNFYVIIFFLAFSLGCSHF